MIEAWADTQAKIFDGQGRVGVPLRHLGHSLHPIGDLRRDLTPTLTVIDTALCPTTAGSVRSFEYALPGLQSPLPANLTLCTFHHGETGFFVRAAVALSRLATRVLSVQQGRRLIRVDLGGRGLPFSGGDCLGWAHARNQGLAFTDALDSASVQVRNVSMNPLDMSTLGTLKSESDFQRAARTYAVRFVARPHSDPFGCWEGIMLGTPSMTGAGILFNTRTQLHCCYNAPLQAKSSEMPACFGLVDGRYHGTGTLGYQWFHPSHCCKEVSLAKALVASIRCESSAAQSPWRAAISESAQCFALCCSGLHQACIAKRLLITRRSSVGSHRRRIGGRRLRNKDGLSTVADCPAAAALLGLLHDASADTKAPGTATDRWSLHNAGAKYDGVCALYGYDHADCCLVRACKEEPRECVACLLSEVPWGSWSRPQRTILAHVARKLGKHAEPQTPNIRTLQSALRNLLIKDNFLPHRQPDTYPKTFVLLIAALLQAVEATEGQPHLYDALHALQVTAPLESISPLDVVSFLEQLAPQGSQGALKEERVCVHSWPSDRKHSAPVRGERTKRKTATQDACSVAASALRISLIENIHERCCPKSSWPALVRAAAEGNYWITGVFAMCVLCEMAPTWPRNRLMGAVDLVDNYLLCPTGQSCSWQPKHCGHAIWNPILSRLRASTTCILLPAGMAPSSLLLPPTQAPPQRPARIHNHAQTMNLLRKGFSLMRMNDGEQLMMHSGFNHPLTRLSDTMIRLRLAASAACPGLCIGLLHPDDEDSLRAVGPTHYDWWSKRGFRLTRSLFRDGIFPGNKTYCFGLATYRPKYGHGKMTPQQFADAWDLVFANRSVLFVSPADNGFAARCGDCKPLSKVLYGGGQRVAPFRRARSLMAMNPHLIKFTSITGVDWGQLVPNVRMAANMARADTVAVSWGPYADILVAELACRGLRALDIGNLPNMLKGNEAGGPTDPDDI